MFPLKERLKEILLRDKIITQDDLDKALAEQKKSGGELSKVLIRLKLINEKELTLLLSEGLGIPPIDISRLKIDPEVIKVIPKDIATNYKIMPISKIGKNLTLAMADPLNIFAIDNVESLTNLKINPIIGKSSDIDEAIEKYYSAESGDTTQTFKDIIKDIKDHEELELIKEIGGEYDKDAVEDLTQEAPIIKLTDTIIQQAVIAKASDVFIEPMEKTMRIRYRVDGVIREIDSMSKALLFPLVSRIKVISTLDISERRLPQDGRFRTIMDEREIDFRVSVLPTAFGEKVVLRVLDKTSASLEVESLGFDDQALKNLEECSARPHGMILTCGPTGSGKTTTLYSVLQFIDTPEKNIVTVEDPVEYQMPGMNQVNVKPSLGLTFAAALRSILRQDPDVILIGEIRDTETLDIAVKSALTGHLVLSSLHTTTASGSIIRMMNMGIEPFLICSSVIAIVGQRLVRKICINCQEEFSIPKELSDKLGLKSKNIKFFRGKGCKACLTTGYKGRVVISEMLILTPKVKELILHRAGEFKIKEAGRKDGMVTMREDGLKKASEGLTTLEEVLRVTSPDEEKEVET